MDQSEYTTTTQRTKKLQIEHRTGDVFESVPARTLIVHSCNAQGIWGADIAKEFRKRYTAAYLNYRFICRTSDPSDLLGRAMLIFPPSVEESMNHCGQPMPRHFIGCLFCRKDRVVRDQDMAEYQNNVLINTRDAMMHLLHGIAESIGIGDLAPDDIQEIRMPKINAGRFQIPWHMTNQVLMGLDVFDKYPALMKIVVYGQ